MLQVLKQKVSRALRGRGRKKIPGQLSLAFAAAATEERAFWQRRFYDFNVWSSKKVREKLEYMHANPVKRKLVVHPKDWPWSSWSYYAKGDEGLIGIDPVDGGETTRTEQKTEKEKVKVKNRTLKPKL